MVKVFAILNFVFVLFALGGFVYHSLDTFASLANPDILDSMPLPGAGGENFKTMYFLTKAVILLSGLAFSVLYTVTGIGLLKHAVWGYKLHYVTAILTTFSFCACCLGCGGFIYTIVALIYANKPEFKAEFPGLEGSSDGVSLTKP